MSIFIPPTKTNYIGVFLTFDCTLNCPYCINKHNKLAKRGILTGDEWIEYINRIQTRSDLPVTLQGGEPTCHPDFYKIVNGIREDIPVDVLTNLETNIYRFMENISPDRLKRDAPYASIRVSYHPGITDKDSLIRKVDLMRRMGYSIGIWAVDHPEYSKHVRDVQAEADSMGIDFRLKEFLGPWKGKMYGTLRYPDSVGNSNVRSCDCKTSEILVDPLGYVFRCHSDLYANRLPIGHLRDITPHLLDRWRKCTNYGVCNSCDVKLKTNRFQQYGHSSVEIRNIHDTT